ncbi:uncharacterized protein BDV14DRAFT_182325 [Aspergillus stella-maris]|uniref:uncharacterized protein n=1 Tax=Aspergillus stella-maris TaxID=1810926 RepID=UPI003CCD1789
MIYFLLIFFLGTATAEDAGSYLDSYGVNGMMLWTEPNCHGIPASTIFDDTTVGQNISNACVTQSFKLLRPLHGEEQLDISIAPQLDLWDAVEGQSLANNIGCTSFIQSYFPVNESTGCYNTPPFTCHRLWINHGLSSNFRGLMTSASVPSPWPQIIPSSCGTSRTRSGAVSSGTIQSSQTPESSHQLESSALLSSRTKTRSHSACSKPSSSRVHSASITPSSSRAHSASTPPSSSSSANRVHTVQVNGSSSTLFDPIQLNAIPVGDVVSFRSDSVFQLINTTLENVCEIVHRFPVGTQLDYRVMRTDPSWFYACPPQGYHCHCNEDTHFAINPGTLSELYSEKQTEDKLVWVPPTTTTTTTTTTPLVTVTATVHVTLSDV